jgi:hypothetical protein
MRYSYTIAVFGVLLSVLLFSGCTSTAPQVQATTAVPTTVVIPSPAITQVPFPNALSVNEYATFGSGTQQGRASVTRYQVKPDYSWTDPSWNSPSEQLASSQPNDVQEGYNQAKPKEGNTFLFVYVSVENTGSDTIFVPSANQFVVFVDGKAYNYTSVHGSSVIISTVSDSQYRFVRGQRDPIEYIQPGDTKVAGYLIYEIPAPFMPGKTYVASNLDYKNSAVWKLG